MRSVATIWYGRMTSSVLSAVRTQYFVRMLSSECLARNVLANAVRSSIRLLLASAHQEVNSKLLEVFLAARDLFSWTWRWRVVLE